MPSEVERLKMMQLKTLLYDGLLRNQVHLPELEANLCTHYFLNGVYESEIFSWSMQDVRVRNCATIPNIQDLQKLTVTAITEGLAAGEVFPPGSVDKVKRL
jgi:hypothetical protein